VTKSKCHTDDPHIFVATVQNSVARATRQPEFVQPWPMSSVLDNCAKRTEFSECKMQKKNWSHTVAVRDTQTYRVEVQIHSFWTSVTEETGFNLTPRVLYPRERTQVGPRTGLEVSEKRKISCLHHNSNSTPSRPLLADTMTTPTTTTWRYNTYNLCSDTDDTRNVYLQGTYKTWRIAKNLEWIYHYMSPAFV
jgi:hypothetical protein